MAKVNSEQQAFYKIFELYEVNEFDLVAGDYEVGDNGLVIDEINRIRLR